MFGSPGSDQIMVEIAYPMFLSWERETIIKKFKCHKLIAHKLQFIFNDTLEHYGLEKIHELGLNVFGGCSVQRKKRGSKKEWSMHSYGIAVDLDPENNRLEWNKSKARFALPEYDFFWKIVENYGGVSLGRERDYDWMHFQFARLNDDD